MDAPVLPRDNGGDGFEMNCEECQENLSLFLDDELERSASIRVEQHLANCDECAAVCSDFSAILFDCGVDDPVAFDDTAETSVPPNPQALWCRINNILENEARPETVREELEPEKRRFLWQLTFPQVASAVLAVAVISSLLTIVGIKNYTQPGPDEISAESSSPSFLTVALSKVGLAETPQDRRFRRVAEQKAAIEYWNKRVQERRILWDKHIRDAFDRNLKVIDESVNEYTLILQQDPDDELSGEMLNSVLKDKMDLLREFSEL